MQKKRTFKSFKLNLWKSSESDWISANLADWVCSLRGEITKSGVLATFRCSFSSDLSWTILFWKLKWILRANFVHWVNRKLGWVLSWKFQHHSSFHSTLSEKPRESKGNWQGKNWRECSNFRKGGIFHFLSSWIQAQVKEVYLGEN